MLIINEIMANINSIYTRTKLDNKITCGNCNRVEDEVKG